jgi:hypothetical protein
LAWQVASHGDRLTADRAAALRDIKVAPRRPMRYLAAMRQRFAAILCLALLASSLAGCSKCGWLWDEGGRACHSSATR